MTASAFALYVFVNHCSRLWAPFEFLRGPQNVRCQLFIETCDHDALRFWRRNGRRLSGDRGIGKRMMLDQLHLIPLAGFAGLMVVAAIEDCRRLIIPNTLVVGLVVLWPFFLLTTPDKTAAAWGIASSSVAFLVGAILFARGYCGGGDVKLFAAASLWAGVYGMPPLLFLTSVFGGGLALFLLTPLGAQLSALRRPAGESATAVDAKPSIPYGLAIAAAALIVTIPPHFH